MSFSTVPTIWSTLLQSRFFGRFLSKLESRMSCSLNLGLIQTLTGTDWQPIDTTTAKSHLQSWSLFSPWSSRCPYYRKRRQGCVNHCLKADWLGPTSATRAKWSPEQHFILKWDLYRAQSQYTLHRTFVSSPTDTSVVLSIINNEKNPNHTPQHKNTA